jgi:L-seryl-tRNA(Ser) seleniumtransferase
MSPDYRELPSVDALVREVQSRSTAVSLPHDVVVEAARSELARIREAISDEDGPITLSRLADCLEKRLAHLVCPTLIPVINATGIIIHTNLGRVPLSHDAVAAASEIANGYSNLEYDLDAGERGSRHKHAETLLCELTGAEAALVVNNNAAAILLVLAAIGAPGEVVLSRGEAVEIGGGFRIPDVLSQSGATLIEVGTTNRTYAQDYESAVTERTTILLRVHRSNFRLVGFVHSPELIEVVEVGRRNRIPVVDDLGSGTLLATEKYGLIHEPTVRESVMNGASIACFSGDKLLGGPQAGIIVGKSALVEKLRHHPMLRAIRVDKITSVQLQVTLLHYLRNEAEQKIPVWRMISRPVSELDAVARDWATRFVEAGCVADVVDAESAVGGGALPGSVLPTKAVAIGPRAQSNVSGWPTRLARMLRAGRPPVVGRIDHQSLLLDPRTVAPERSEALVASVLHALAEIDSGSTQRTGIVRSREAWRSH